MLESFTPRQIAAVVDAVDLLKGVGVSLSQVAREYVDAFKILRRQPLIAEAAKHYAAYLERQKEHPRREVSRSRGRILEGHRGTRTFRSIYRGLHKSSLQSCEGLPWLHPENYKLRH